MRSVRKSFRELSMPCYIHAYSVDNAFEFYTKAFKDLKFSPSTISLNVCYNFLQMPVMPYLLKGRKENLTYCISHSVRRSWYGVLKISTNTIVWFFVCAVNLAFYCLVLFHCLLGLIAKKLSDTLRAVTRGFSAFRGLTQGLNTDGVCRDLLGQTTWVKIQQAMSLTTDAL